MTTDLLDALDPAWVRGDPSGFPGFAARRAELGASAPQLEPFYVKALERVAGATDPAQLQAIHVALLGRERGVVTRALSELPQLALEERKLRGRWLNLIKQDVETAIRQRRAELERQNEARAAGFDVTLPGRRPWVGRKHVLAQVQDELLELFHGLGYSVYTSPEVELDEYNFGKLNFMPDHPARDAHDTYWVDDPVLLRTHTSPGWVRAMEERKPPLRLVFPGRVYRAEQVDATHLDQFHQMDGLFVDRDVSMADLKGTLATFARAIYCEKVRTRLIPVYFPFVEPGAQMDVSCILCDGEGRVRGPEGERRCAICKGSGWLEVLGAGMVHPNVFRAVGYDPEEVTGFAFGMGIDRIAMLRYGVPDLRLFFENDLRFLHQF